MSFHALSASSKRHLLTPVQGSPNEEFSHARMHSSASFQDPSHGQNRLFKDPSTLSTNDLNFQKVLQKDNGVTEQTFYQLNIENPKLMRKARRSELAAKKSCLTRVWQTALVTGLILVALGVAIGGLAYWISIPKVITQPFLLYGESCLVNSRSCDATRLLWCPAGTCTCIGNFNWNATAQNCSCTTYQIWNGIQCQSYGHFGDPCNTNLPCLPTLTCQAVINQTYSTGQSICDCDNATYLDVGPDTCVPRLGYNASCQSQTSCQTWYGLSCTSYLGGTYCRCGSTSYWNGSMCTSNALGGQPCSVSVPCDTTRGLYCNSSTATCQCDYLDYWDNFTTQTCVQKLTYGISCQYTFQCNTSVGLSCPSISNGCNCPTSLSPGKCDCQSSNYFWDGQQCGPIHTFNGTCPKQCACGSNLVCTFGHCVCPGNMIWSTSTNNCTCPSSAPYWVSPPNTCLNTTSG